MARKWANSPKIVVELAPPEVGLCFLDADHSSHNSRE